MYAPKIPKNNNINVTNPAYFTKYCKMYVLITVIAQTLHNIGKDYTGCLQNSGYLKYIKK